MVDEVVGPSNPVENNDANLKGLLDSFENRIAELELAKEQNRLSANEKYRALLMHEIMQRISMRYIISAFAGLVILAMGYIAVCPIGRGILAEKASEIPQLAAALFIAPIVSISALTIMLMVGAFRRFKDDDMDKVNITSLAAEVTKSGTGN